MSVQNPAPQGKLSIVEWATIIATGFTMLVSFGSIMYLSGSYGNRIEHIAEATKDVPVQIQAIKSDLTHLQELKAEVKELSTIKERVIVLESKIK